MAELVLIFDTVTGLSLAKQVGSTHIGDLAIVSGKLGAGAVISGSVASGSIGTPHLAAGSVLSAIVGANVLATPHIANQGILSASFGAGSIGGAHVAAFGLVSGAFASGAVTEGALASGISIDIAETAQEPSFRSVLSGIQAYEAVTFTLSGYFDWARAAQSGRAPAIGLAAGAITSGSLGTLLTFGRITNTGWNFSGYIGQTAFLGTSSQVVMSAPAASGNYVQRLGQVVAPATIIFFPDITLVQIGQ